MFYSKKQCKCWDLVSIYKPMKSHMDHDRPSWCKGFGTGMDSSVKWTGTNCWYYLNDWLTVFKLRWQKVSHHLYSCFSLETHYSSLPSCAVLAESDVFFKPLKRLSQKSGGIYMCFHKHITGIRKLIAVFSNMLHRKNYSIYCLFKYFKKPLYMYPNSDCFFDPDIYSVNGWSKICFVNYNIKWQMLWWWQGSEHVKVKLSSSFFTLETLWKANKIICQFGPCDMLKSSRISK